MGNSEEQCCSFCLCSKGDENCMVINGFIKQALNVVMPKLDIVNYSQHFICNFCTGKLSDALIFKSTCLTTDDTLFPYIKKEVSVDLREIYIKERGISISADENICRLCMEPVREEFVFANELDVDFFQKFIPEVNLSVTLDPCVCNKCVGNLIVHSSFIKRSFKSKEKVLKFYTEKGGSEETYVPFSDVCFDIKREQDDSEDINTFGIETNYESKVEKQENTIETEEIEIKDENISQSLQTLDPSKKLGEFEMKRSDGNSKIQGYACEIGDYKSKMKGGEQRDMLMHKYSSEIRWFKCDKCEYKSKHNSSLKTHMLRHKESSEIQWLKCDICEYKAKLKGNLKRHMLAHKNSLKDHSISVTWVYKSKVKGSLKRHMLTHKDSSEIQSRDTE